MAHAPFPAYGVCELPRLPELPRTARPTTCLAALRRLLAEAKWDGSRFGTPQWNPLGQRIGPGRKVVVKPNLVLHENRSRQGWECMVTHADLIEAVLHYLVKAEPASVVIGDAPVQGCDFEMLLAATGLRKLVDRFRAAGSDVALRDFRKVTLPGGCIEHGKQDGGRGLDEYVLFDLGPESLLEPITKDSTRFRVTMYNPQALRRTHGAGRHQYLVAREVIEADVVINLPKLKTHKKCGLTGALKNMVGINGHKEYLPHHRQGSPAAQGDCYGRRSALKSCAERLLDRANSSSRAATRYFFSRSASMLLRGNRWCGGDGDVEGSWHGNDTVWRMCLDLQRILRYGTGHGRLAATPQRSVVNITDAIVAGEANGPLAPEPVPLGIVSLGASPAAVDWVHALLMGFDPSAIPLVRESFALRSYPVADFPPDQIRVHAEGKTLSLAEVADQWGVPFTPPPGWQGHCELRS